jgi:hypothetical protein
MMVRSVFVGCTKPVAAVRLKADIKPIAEVHATTAKLPRPQGSDISAAPQLFRHELFVEHRQNKIAPRLRVAMDLRPRKIEPEVFEPLPIVIDDAVVRACKTSEPLSASRAALSRTRPCSS